MSEPKEQRAEETAEQEIQAGETEAPGENVEAASEAEQGDEAADQSEAAPVIWSQKRVPNIEKGYNPSVPFYMMGILAALVILSLVFAKITS